MTIHNSPFIKKHPEIPVQATLASNSVAETVASMLHDLGVEYAFGISGGSIVPMWLALENSPIQVIHCRHEGGSAFAAVEAHFASNRPVAVFTTTGPGLTNALTGLFAARWENAKVILISASTPTERRGRWACQETSSYRTPMSGIFTSGSLFHYATVVESTGQLSQAQRRLASGLAQPGGFVAHISISPTLQSHPVERSLPSVLTFSRSLQTASDSDIARCARLLSEESFAIWVGHGARDAADALREFAERTGVAVMSSPRGKGIFPENHPQYVGVTGFGGHQSVLTYMQEHCPQRTLVLGTRLGELTSFWSPSLVPEKGFIHVDIDPEVPGTAYPDVETVAIQSDIGAFIKALLEYFPGEREKSPKMAGLQEVWDGLLVSSYRRPQFPFPRPQWNVDTEPSKLVRPEVLMEKIQAIVVEQSDAIVMTEAGNSLAWAINKLWVSQPHRFRASTGFGSMGHFAVGVVGAAMTGKKAVAIVGDGAMLMNNEIGTAVQYGAPAVWIVLNDASYNMVAQVIPEKNVHHLVQIPQADFVQIARAMGADGIRVTRESEIQGAIEAAMAAKIPFVVDVVIDPSRRAPTESRMNSLKSQGAVQ